jgi:hypothetical protein
MVEGTASAKSRCPDRTIQGFAVEGTALTVIMIDVVVDMISILHFIYNYTDARVV